MDYMIKKPLILAMHWDVDGVLVDSGPQHIAKLKCVCQKYGVTLTDADFPLKHTFAVPDGAGEMKDVVMPLHGAGDKNIYYWLLSKRPELACDLTKDQWLDQLLSHYIANKHLLKPREDIVDTVERLHLAGALQDVVTSGIPAQVDANMHALGAASNHMLFKLTANDVTKGKPDPEGYQIAAQRVRQVAIQRSLNVELFDVGIEDSPVGVQSLFNANMPAIHYVLPGNEPAVPSERMKPWFRIARTAAEVYDQAMDLLNTAIATRDHVCRQNHFLMQNRP